MFEYLIFGRGAVFVLGELLGFWWIDRFRVLKQCSVSFCFQCMLMGSGSYRWRIRGRCNMALATDHVWSSCRLTMLCLFLSGRCRWRRHSVVLRDLGV